MALRKTLERAVLATTLLTPLPATLIGFSMGHDNNLPSGPTEWLWWFISVPMAIYPIGLFGTILGILIVALPVTYAIEKLSHGNAPIILFGNLAVGSIGFAMAATAETSHDVLLRIFWLHWGIASIIFTALYLFRSERPGPRERLANA